MFFSFSFFRLSSCKLFGVPLVLSGVAVLSKGGVYDFFVFGFIMGMPVRCGPYNS